MIFFSGKRSLYFSATVAGVVPADDAAAVWKRFRSVSFSGFAMTDSMNALVSTWSWASRICSSWLRRISLTVLSAMSNRPLVLFGWCGTCWWLWCSGWCGWYDREEENTEYIEDTLPSSRKPSSSKSDMLRDVQLEGEMQREQSEDV